VEGELSTDADVAYPEDERRHRGDRRLQVVVELRAGVKLAEGFLPVVTQIAIRDVIAAPDSDGALDFLLRLVAGQIAQVPLLRVVRLLAPLLHGGGARLLQL